MVWEPVASPNNGNAGNAAGDVILGNDDECGICDVCVGRLRDANSFKLQVQRCQVELQAMLAAALQVQEELEESLKSEEGNNGTIEDSMPYEVEEPLKSEEEDNNGTIEDSMPYREPSVKSESEGAASDDDIESLATTEHGTPETDMVEELASVNGDSLSLAIRYIKAKGLTNIGTLAFTRYQRTTSWLLNCGAESK
ncbi:uncharacterized protein LOC134803065 [Cydia splendana]|uniref:uncharacterized protein LOC134803065 n=1 Tax=Cydia splendana TaxID=1100963 RepID=UPI00300D448E